MGKVKDHIPMRTCIACGAKRPKKHLLRFALIRENIVVNDHSGALPGRGAYVCDDQSCLSQAAKKNRLNRAFRKKGVLAFETMGGLERN